MPLRTHSTANRIKGDAMSHSGTADDRASTGTQYAGSTDTMTAPAIPRTTAGPSSWTIRHGSGEEGVPQQQIPEYNPGPANMAACLDVPDAGTAVNGPLRSVLTSRRRQTSIPNPKAPLGPRPLDTPGSQRAFSNSVLPNHFTNISGASALASQDPYTHQLSINDISRFSFASIAPPKASPRDERKDPLDFGDFLVPLNFNDFRTTITSTEPQLSHFPLPGRGGTRAPSDPADTTPPSQSPIPIAAANKGPANTYLGRKGSSASNANKFLNKADPMLGTNNSALRARRQSHFPPNAFNNNPPTTTTTTTARAPRKSIGPGTFLPPELPENTAPQRRPSGGRRTLNPEGDEGGLSLRLVNKGNNPIDQSLPSPRAIKAKSMLEPGAHFSKELLTPSRTPDPTRSIHTIGNGTPQKPGRSGTPGRTTTPGASNRRISVMPPSHAKGLGARTVSPTDARRMRRMSAMPHAPPLPQSRISQAPPTPQPEMPAVPLQSPAHSPAPLQRKSLTPSSSRTTPDPNRKSYSSGQSLSSSTSYGSNRNSTAIPVRVPQNASSSSRLPTPKPRVETGSLPSEEEVPPVPAIPRAYESPASEIDQPFFSARSSSLPPFDLPDSDDPDLSAFADALQTIDTPRPPSASSRHSGTRLTQVETEARQKPQSGGSKKNHGFRLPPLTLRPLAVPSVGLAGAAEAESTPPDERTITPPAYRSNLRTPSTPLTASKASFFSRNKKTDEQYKNLIRSNTSHFTFRDEDEYRPPSSSSPNLPPFAFEGASDVRGKMSPFISSSLPKTNNEFESFMPSNFGTDIGRTTMQLKPNGPRAPSFSVTPKPEPQPGVVDSQESTFSATSLRRKLSRKRSGSTTKEMTKHESDAVKYDNMPPPKLPASATWNNLAMKSSSPTSRPSFLKSRRKTSASNVSMSNGPNRQSNFGGIQNVTSESPQAFGASQLHTQPNRSTSFLASTRNLTAHKSNSQIGPPESTLDKEDLVAEEEMKKLAAKRKDFESAARELDNLRRRARPAESMSPTLAVQITDLNIYERGEIIDFPDVYFTGTKNAKKIVGDPSQETTNCGYDDDRGDYNIVEGDHLAYRYEIVDLLGKGSFGQVVRCIDHKTGMLVAVKIIRNKKRFHQQALVEVNILQKLRDWDPNLKYSVVNFDQSFYFRYHLCISTELLGMNLYEFIKAHDFRGFSLKLIRRFTKQMLNSLVLLHGHKVIHCDLKPENVLLAHPIHSEIKVIDFGSSCFENEKVYTYIQSRFYRSPEVILGMSYGMPIDMWSLGCILAELFTGYPIFPGENEQEQLACIMEVFGPPEKHLIEKSSRKKLFFDSMGKPRLTVSSKGRRRRPSSKELRQVLKCDNEAFLDFLARCLRWDPARRMSPHEAAQHEFVTGVKANTAAARKTVSSAVNSPIRRVNSVIANGAVRPLPQPPAAGQRGGLMTRQDSATASPSKRPIRQPTVNGLQAPGSTAKRASHAAMNASSTSLSKTAGQRAPQGKSDMATAAATASLVR